MLAALSIALLVGFTAHGHGDVPAETASCVVCAVAHDSAAPLPSQPAVAALSERELEALPEPIRFAKQIRVARPSARAPPSEKPTP